MSYQPWATLFYSGLRRKRSWECNLLVSSYWTISSSRKHSHLIWFDPYNHNVKRATVSPTLKFRLILGRLFQSPQIPFWVFVFFFSISSNTIPQPQQHQIWPTPQLAARPILNPLSKTKNQTRILTEMSVLNPLSHNGNSSSNTFYKSLFWDVLVSQKTISIILLIFSISICRYTASSVHPSS